MKKTEYIILSIILLCFMSCEKDRTGNADWTDETLWPLVSHADIGSMMWAMSAFVVITSRTPPAGVDPRVYRLACRIIRDKIEQAIEAKLKVAESCP